MLNYINLQMYAEAAGADGSYGAAATTAENSMSDGMAAGGMGEQIATAPDDQAGESWDSLIGKGGRFEKDYKASVAKAVKQRLKNQQDLQGRIDAINPIVQHLAKKYKIGPNSDGSIPIDALSNAVLYDEDSLRDEAYERGMTVDTLREVKQLEAQNRLLQNQQKQANMDREWNQIAAEAAAMKEYFPDFDLDVEMTNPQFMHLVATLRSNGFENSVQTAYQICHQDEINGSMMEFATRQATQKVAASVRAGRNRPREGAAGASAAGGSVGTDPSKFTRDQLDDYIARAAAGEKIYAF